MSMDDELTQEEQISQYLLHNPGVEAGLWAEWVVVVCEWGEIDPPTNEEWLSLKANFHRGKTPAASVAELKVMREKRLGVAA